MTIIKNCVNMHIKHIQWGSDCLILYFGTLKGNLNRERSSDPWNVYSNLKNPKICLVLALDEYLFSNPDILTTNSHLFTGYCKYERFRKKVIKDNFDRFQPLGVEKGMLGAYSIRKRAIYIVATICTVSPPMASIFLRAG